MACVLYSNFLLIYSIIYYILTTFSIPFFNSTHPPFLLILSLLTYSSLSFKKWQAPRDNRLHSQVA